MPGRGVQEAEHAQSRTTRMVTVQAFVVILGHFPYSICLIFSYLNAYAILNTMAYTCITNFCLLFFVCVLFSQLFCLYRVHTRFSTVLLAYCSKSYLARHIWSIFQIFLKARDFAIKIKHLT